MNEKQGNINKLLLHPNFKKTVNEIGRLNIRLPSEASSPDIDFDAYNLPGGSDVVTKIERKNIYKLDPLKGQDSLKNELVISAYDESFRRFSSLEGTAFLTSHALIIQHQEDYIPSAFLTFNFYTRSQKFSDQSDYLKFSDNPEKDFKEDYIEDRANFILGCAPKNSILFIDGPLIGGQVSSRTTRLNDELLNKDIMPFFFVKNSTSNMVTDNIKELRGKFNSDMHWAFSALKPGERTCLFRYVDQYNPKNSRIFCYMKGFNVSPQRIEMHTDTFEKHQGRILEFLNLIYYLLLVQGSPKDPQIRPIKIAELYARSTFRLINLEELMKSTGIMPTMNQERFGW